MSIYKKLSKMGGDKSLEEKLYELLQTDTYKTDVYQYRDLGEGMAVLHKNFWGWYKPWMVINHNRKTAFEFMNDGEKLVTVTEDDIDWKSLKKLPEDAICRAQWLSFHFPSFICGFKNGVAQVDWQLNPDGRYYMDDDGYGMTADEEIEIYGFIDMEGKVVVKFQAINDSKDLDRMRKEAEEIVRLSKMGMAMRRKKFTTPYVVRDGKLMFWHDDDNGSCFGSYPEPTRWMKNIQADKLMEALSIL